MIRANKKVDQEKKEKKWKIKENFFPTILMTETYSSDSMKPR